MLILVYHILLKKEKFEMKLKMEELIQAVKEELLCYEDMQQTAQQWEKEFRLWVKKKKKKQPFFMTIEDEDEIFEIADSYKEAVEEKKVEQYWKEFS